MKFLRLFLFILAMMFVSNYTFSHNPFIMDQFTADPTARVFNGRIYVYPSHDILAQQRAGRIGWFCMEDYHVFSSSNLTDWTDHGVIVNQHKVNWVDSTSFSMWAPDCIERNGNYYFYFPANPKTSYGKGFTIGVAVADNPAGPFTPQSEPIMIANLPGIGLVEGPFLFERKGKYYLTYPHVQNKIERLEYAMADNPLGPFNITGVIMDESPTGCWTNHQSIVEFKNQWYLFYHHNDLSPKFDKNRSIRIDSLFFHEDGTIRKVKPTLRGVGFTTATEKIQLDRYSFLSDNGATIDFMDPLNTFNGWKTILDKPNAWVSYNAVDFVSKKLKSVQVKASSQTGGTLQIRLDKADGNLIAEVKIPKSNHMTTVDASLLHYQDGMHNLFVILEDNKPVEIDWIRFTK